MITGKDIRWLLVMVVTGIFSVPAKAQSIRFNDGWQFKAVEFIDKAGIDSFRRLGGNWSDQFLIEKEDKAGNVLSAADTVLAEVLRPVQQTSWKTVMLPHIAFPEPLVIVKPREGLAYYRKEFVLADSLKGKNISLEFEGAMQVSDVWLNGKYIGRYQGGYLPFIIDLSDKALYGKKNEIVLCVNNKANPVVPPGKPVGKLDFVYYSGIYRDVWLHIKQPVHITNAITADKPAGGGIFVSYPQVSKERAVIEVQTDVINSSNQNTPVSIRQEIIDVQGHVVATVTSGKVIAERGKSKVLNQVMTVRAPHLWHPDHPYLYTLLTTVYAANVPVDKHKTRIGIRSFEITKEKGLLINGAPYRLTGTNRHQNYPYIGNALSDEASYRDVWMIKSAGMNTIRAGHYPSDPSFLDAADELGLLVLNPIPGWQYFNRNPAFGENVMRDIRQMVRRDRNHPCILLWEVSLNETYPDSAFRCRQAEVAREEWKGRKSFFTSGDSYYTKACWDVPYDDWNGDPGKRDNTTYPENAFLIREYGDYEFGGGNSTSRQLRTAGEKNLLQQAWNLQWEHNKNRKIYPRALGDLTWAFFDGLAGCTVGIEGWGMADIFRIPKFSYYFFKSQQPATYNPAMPFSSGPLVYIASYWNQPVDAEKVIVYSNCDSVRLLLNDKALATNTPDKGEETPYGKDLHNFNGGNANHLDHPPFTFTNIHFAPGTLKAIGFRKGKEVAVYSITTPGPVSRLALEPAVMGMPFHVNGDVVFVYAKLTDDAHNLAITSDMSVTMTVKGDAELVSPATVNAEAGIATFLIRSGSKKSIVTLEATAANLPVAEIRMTVK
ncbi:glycoside hydrolase family 2 protein [Chitinophaga flava]|uniref:Glycoside hydrolase family 2 n=1 Tax=Chitinophaga flava TaxID=2259036 RepID=A0A365XYS8_9BACT|nr:glycoside hydrolase family 2 TIM barrel-domain containing protein [Chitinophaga flava]RBL90844.1 glycoside hydrolase family 2 [Chitinophaga flava]